MNSYVKINRRMIGKDNPIYIVAEMSANHQKDFKIAVKIIEAAKKVGADAVKLQTYTAETLTIKCDNKYFKIKGTLWDGQNLYDLYKETYTPWEWQPRLKEIADDIGIDLFSTPFDATAVDFLEKMKVPVYKIASFEITDIPLIKYIASKGKPVIISTGIATKEDIEEAVKACRECGNDQIVLLKCTSSYPAPFEEANLRTIPDLAECFNVISGLSDHTLGISVPVASVALGAKVIEKHFILDKNIKSPDAAFSLDKKEFRAMVSSVREAEKAIGSVSYELSGKAKKNRQFSRSLFVVRDIKSGEKITYENIRSIRPGYGLHPRYYEKILNCQASRDLKKGTPLTWDCIIGENDRNY